MFKIVKIYLTSIKTKTKWNLEVEMFFGNLDAANANLLKDSLPRFLSHWNHLKHKVATSMLWLYKWKDSAKVLVRSIAFIAHLNWVVAVFLRPSLVCNHVATAFHHQNGGRNLARSEEALRCWLFTGGLRKMVIDHQHTCHHDQSSIIITTTTTKLERQLHRSK